MHAAMSRNDDQDKPSSIDRPTLSGCGTVRAFDSDPIFATTVMADLGVLSQCSPCIGDAPMPLTLWPQDPNNSIEAKAEAKRAKLIKCSRGFYFDQIQ